MNGVFQPKKTMDPYHHHHHHHRPLNYSQSSGLSFEFSSLATSRSPHGRTAATPTHAASPPPPGSRISSSQRVQYPVQTAFHRAYDSESTSPGDTGGSMTDPFVQAGSSTRNTSSHGSGGTSNPKRAYRQRRKDPSCDACRERKVKCDATETASCSECSSRNVRCQFTKETNRRMSSIKQFQDLEKQLHQARQQLAHFRAVMSKSDSVMDSGLSSPAYHAAELQSAGSPPAKRKKPAVHRDFSQARADLKEYGRGLLQIPPPHRRIFIQRNKSLELPDLPPRHVTDRLLVNYHENFHVQFPILHWPTFQTQCDELYRTKSLATLGVAWGAVFLSVLACGTLYVLEPSRPWDGKVFLSAAMEMADLWQDDFSIDDARMAFLTGIFLVELNRKSAGWFWIGSAVRISQDIGLHIETGSPSSIEREMRRRLWYSIYAWDRLLALELGKPLIINDTDYDTEYPQPANDEQITNEGTYAHAQSTPLLATVHIVRSVQTLAQLLKSTCITRDNLDALEEYFSSCFSLFPNTFRPSAPEVLDPRTIAPLIYLQNARLLLHRHNLTPVCPADVRLQAIDKCVMLARDTALILSRCLNPALSPKQSSDEKDCLLATSASTLLCMHIWRCLLFLLFRAEYGPAMVLVQAASTIGEARPVNAYCGRYLEFFLRALYARVHTGQVVKLDNDEEMIAYVSGDLQNDPAGSWIWQGDSSGAGGGDNDVDDMATPRKNRRAPPSFDPVRPSPQNKVMVPVMMDREVRDWGGWPHIEQSVRFLLEQGPSWRRSAPRSPTEQHQPPANLPSDISRMTIANII